MSDSWDLPATNSWDIPITKSVPIKSVSKPVSNKPLIIRCIDCDKPITEDINNVIKWFTDHKKTKLRLFNDHKTRQSSRRTSDQKYLKKLSDDIAKIHCEEFKPLCESCRDIKDEKLDNMFNWDESDGFSD